MALNKRLPGGGTAPYRPAVEDLEVRDVPSLVGTPTYLVGAGPVALASGDLNGDGKPDLVVSNQTGNTVGVLLSQANGTFVAGLPVATGKVPGSIRLADVNGDGKTDLLVLNTADGTLNSYLGQGNGAFLAPVTVTLDNQPTTFTTADLNNDGRQDVLIGSGKDGSVRVLASQSDGSYVNAGDFALGLAAPGGSTTPPVGALLTGDWNKDGRQDVAVANGGVVTIFLGKGDGTLLGLGAVAAGGTVQSLATADVDGDGKADLIVGKTDKVAVLLGLGNGAFQAPADYTVPAGSTAVAAGDVTGDGKADLLVTNFARDQVTLLTNTGTGTFNPGQAIDAGSGPTAVLLGDFTGDGKLDAAVTDAPTTPLTAGQVRLLVGNGDGTFQTPKAYAAGLGATGVALADLNHDGFLDAVTADHDANTVSVLLGNGNGTYQAPTHYAVGAGPTGVAVGDLNGDGVADLAVTNHDAGTVSVLLGMGNGTFGAAGDVAVGQGPLAVTVADVNGDGKADLLAVDQVDGTLATALGKGDGTFQPAKIVNVGNEPGALVAGDFNGDGKADVALASSVVGANPGQVRMLLGKGDGTYQPMITSSVNGTPTALVAADLDGDGKLDLAVATAAGADGAIGSVDVLLGKGNGLFKPALHNTVVAGAYGIAAGDVNGDGNLDLVAVHRLTDEVSVLTGKGNGLFNTPALVGVGPRPQGVAVGDVNGDGGADLVLAHGGLPGAPGGSLGVVLNDQPMPNEFRFSAPNYTVTENGGQAVITVVRTGGTGTAATVGYQVSGGTATAGTDYTLAPGTLTFQPGELSKTIVIPIANDNAIEGQETIQLALADPTGGPALGTPATATLTIADDDVALPGTLKLSAGTYKVGEADGQLTVTVVRTGGTDGAVTVDYTTADGTAKAGTNYGATSGTLTFAAGEASKTVSIPIIDNTLYEAGKKQFTFRLTKATGGAKVGGTNIALVTINEDDAAQKSTLQFAATTFTAGESDGTVPVVVKRTGATTGTVLVNYQTIPGTIAAGVGYTPAHGTLTFAPGETEKTVAIALINNKRVALNPQFFRVVLSAPAGGAKIAVGGNVATVKVTDDDSTVHFETAAFFVKEDGGQALVTVKRKGNPVGTVTVQYATSDGSAKAGQDYEAVSGQLSFGDGETMKQFTVPIINQGLKFPNKSVRLKLTGPTGEATLGVSAAVLFIMSI